MRNIIIIALLLMPYCVRSSGGYDNGTATGKGKFRLDLTWNPFNYFDFGQTYAVGSYGITNYFDIHGYISDHQGKSQSWYGGIFYQFLNRNKIHLATAIGIRGYFGGESKKQLFLPQLLYCAFINDRIFIGGSFVNVRGWNLSTKYGTSIDLGLFFNLKYSTKNIEKISLGLGGFHPATWKPDKFFLPTYSININFR